MRLFIQVQIFKYLSILQSLSLRAKCPNTELLLVVFSCIQTEYGDLFRKNLRIQSKCRKIRTRNNSVFGHFSLSVWYSQTHMLGFQAYYSLHTHCLFFFLHLHWHLLLFQFCFELHFLLSSLHLQLHEICFINVFDSFCLVIILNAFKFIKCF